MRVRGTVCAMALVAALAACTSDGDGESGAEPERTESSASSESSPAESPSPTEPTPATTPVDVVVVYNNFLDQPCEALSGIYRGLHNGSRVEIESSSGEVVGTGRLGDPPQRVPKALCAWGATVESTLEPGEQYLARAATRFTSPLLDESDFATTRLVIEASK